MRVVIGLTRRDAQADAEATWAEMEARVRQKPFDCAAPQFDTNEPRCYDLPPGATANAELVRATMTLPGYVRICAPDAFFRRPQDERVLILLHELCHVRLYQGRLSANYSVIQHLQRNLQHNAVAPGTFEWDRSNLAAEILGFAQEVGVDRFIAKNYAEFGPTYLPLRSSSYYSNGEANRYDDVRSPSLAVYRAFFKLLRASLGVAIAELVRDKSLGQDLQRLQQRYETELLAVTRDWDWFAGQRARLLGISIDSDEPDTDTYRDVFDRVMSVSQ